MSKKSFQPSALLQALNDVVIPALHNWEGQTMLLAQPTRRVFLSYNDPLPPGVTTTQRNSPGRRVAVRGAGSYRDTTRPTGRWPQEGLISASVPMLITPVQGVVDFRIGDYSLHLRPGHFCLLPPDVPRTGGDDSHIEPPRNEDEQCDLLWLRPRQGAMECWICHSHGKLHESASENRLIYVHYTEAISQFETLLHEALTRPGDWGAVCKSIVTMMLLVMRRHIAQNEFIGYGMAMQLPPDVPRPRARIFTACDYIQKHLHERLTINEVARACYMSRTHFTNRFRQQTGQSFTEFLTQCRLERAKILLRETDWPICRVSAVVGMTPAHLRQLFAQHLGQSPREYQKAVAERDEF